MTTLPITGLELRDAGVAATLAADAAPHRDAAPFIHEAVEAFASQPATFTADDVRDALRDNDTVVRALRDRPNLLPAVFSSAAKAGLIRVVGYTRATRPTRRASVIRVWQGVQS